jgi:hypothetical protein
LPPFQRDALFGEKSRSQELEGEEEEEEDGTLQDESALTKAELDAILERELDSAIAAELQASLYDQSCGSDDGEGRDPLSYIEDSDDESDDFSVMGDEWIEEEENEEEADEEEVGSDDEEEEDGSLDVIMTQGKTFLAREKQVESSSTQETAMWREYEPEVCQSRNVFLHCQQQSGFHSESQTCCPQNEISDDISQSSVPTLEALKAVGFLNEHFAKHVTACTNYYAENGGKGGKELSKKKMKEKDFYTWFTIFLLMMIVRTRSLKDYWEKGPTFNPTIRDLMPYKRFRAILSCLHVTMVNPKDKEGHANKTEQNPMWRVQWLIDYFNTVFKRLYIPGPFVSMDEFMIPTKIRHFLKQFIKGKPHKWGIKLYMAACPTTGFCLHFQIHDGRQKKVLEMVKSAIPQWLIRYGRILVVDNFYTCMDVAKWVMSKGMHLIGTLQSNRIDLSHWTLPATATRGKIAAYEWIDDDANSKGLYILSWVDRRVVNMMTTLPIETHNVIKKVTKKIPSQRRKVYQQATIKSPTCVQIYNKKMGAVDTVGSFTHTAHYPFRSRKWSTHVIFGLFSIAISNAHKLLKTSSPKHRKMSMSKFLKQAVSDLLIFLKPKETPPRTTDTPETPNSESPVSSPLIKRRRLHVYQSSGTNLSDKSLHVPVKFKNNSWRCSVCHTRRSSFCCTGCDHIVCLDQRAGITGSDTIKETCWFKLHNSNPQL